MENFGITDIITPHITQLARLLSKLKINFNFVDVSDGFWSDIEGKKFIRNPKGLKRSPRTFVRYKYDEDKIPNPESFLKSMNNSKFIFYLSLTYLSLTTLGS